VRREGGVESPAPSFAKLRLEVLNVAEELKLTPSKDCLLVLTSKRHRRRNGQAQGSTLGFCLLQVCLASGLSVEPHAFVAQRSGSFGECLQSGGQTFHIERSFLTTQRNLPTEGTSSRRGAAMATGHTHGDVRREADRRSVAGRTDVGRRDFLRRGLGALGGATLSKWFGSSGAANRVRAADAAVNVSFWHANSGPLGTILTNLAKQFNVSHPRYQIQPEFAGNYTALNQKIMGSVAAGAQPDAAQVGAYGAVAEYLKEGLIVPVQKFIDGPDGLSKSSLADIFSGFLEDNAYRVEHKPALVSWPFNKSVMVFYYNGTLLKALGLDVPKTWDEFVAASDKAMKAGRVAAGIGWTPGTDFFAALLYQNGGRLLSQDSGSVLFHSEAGVRALSFLKDLNDKKIMYLTKQFDWQNDLLAQKVCFAVSTIVSQQYIQQDLKGAWDLGVAPLPAGVHKATILFGSNGVIFAKAKPEAQAGAWTFFKWWAEPEQTALWSSQSHYLPLRRSALAMPPMRDVFAKDPRQRVALESLDYAHPMPDNVAGWVRIDPVLQDAITKAITGLAMPRDALKEAATKANAILRT
jgi:ABC-type glycerol-3-phosphate transport system substrate-binding protein